MPHPSPILHSPLTPEFPDSHPIFMLKSPPETPDKPAPALQPIPILPLESGAAYPADRPIKILSAAPANFAWKPAKAPTNIFPSAFAIVVPVAAPINTLLSPETIWPPAAAPTRVFIPPSSIPAIQQEGPQMTLFTPVVPLSNDEPEGP